MANRLMIKELFSVGAVDAGDDPEATMVFWKRKDSPEPGGAPDGVVSGSPDEGGTERKDISMDDVLKALDDEQRAALEAHIEAEVEKRAAAEPEEEVEKVLPDDVQELIAKANAERDEAVAKAEQAAFEKRTNEWVAKAIPLEDALGAADEIGPILRDIDEKAPEELAKILPALEAAAQRIETGGLFVEKGKETGEEAVEPLSKRDSWVEKNRKETESLAAARARYWQEHPDAMAASREEA